MMESPVDLSVWGPSSSIENMNRWTTYARDLFIVANDCVGPSTLLE